VGLGLLDVAAFKATPTRKLSRWLETRGHSNEMFMQALDLFFESNAKMQEFKHFKLTESDWEILEGLEFVLLVS